MSMMRRWVLGAISIVGCGDDGGPSGSASDASVTETMPESSGDAVTSDDTAGGCVPFDGVDDCGDGMFCLARSATAGECTPAAAEGSDSEEPCSPALSACAEDRICQAVSGGMTICVDMCRFSMGDGDCAPMRTCIDAYDLEEVGGCAPA
jgi:hypothetical protein